MKCFGIPVFLAALLAADTAQAEATANAGKTGSGGMLASLGELQQQFDQQWDGRPGQFAKGALGAIGLARALGAAYDALTYEKTVRRDGSTSKHSSAGDSGSGAGSVTATSTATSTH